MNILRLAASAVFISALAPQALAQTQDLGERLQDAARLEPKRFDLPELPRPFEISGVDSGVTHWVSPMLLNAPGTIGGEPFTIDRQRLMRWFEFSVINPANQGPANIWMGCFDESGAAISRYTARFAVPPMGAVNWSSATVAPEPTTDGATSDQDNVWCLIGGDRSIVAYGWSVRRLGGDVRKNHFSLERAAAVGE